MVATSGGDCVTVMCLLVGVGPVPAATERQIQLHNPDSPIGFRLSQRGFFRL